MYGKIFASLFHGSMAGQGDLQLVFVFLVAHAEKDGRVEVHPTEVSALTGLSVERVQDALAGLEAIDPLSRSPAEEGRRIIRDTAGFTWRVVNYPTYLAARDRETRRNQNREAKRRQRARGLLTVSHRQPPSAQGEGEGEAQREESTPLAIFDGRAGPPPSANGKPPKQEWLEAFAEFYAEYPRKVKPDAARRAWLAVKPWSQDRCDEVYASMGRWKDYWAAHETPRDKIPYPATFLNGGQWKEPPG